MTQTARPTSPHLQIYKPQLTSFLSITHRMTGVVAFLGSIFMLLWLTSLAWDHSIYSMLQKIALSWPVQIILFFWSLSLVYHLFNGVRHMAWDIGKGFSKPDIYKSGKFVVIASIVVNILIWISR